MMRLLYISICVLLISCTKKSTTIATKHSSIQLSNPSDTVQAGDPLHIIVEGINYCNNPGVWVSNVYANEWIVGKKTDAQTMEFTIPVRYMKKRGDIDISLFYNGKKQWGVQKHIVANENTPQQIDFKLGPKLLFNNPDYTAQLTLVITDIYGNPISDGNIAEIALNYPTEEIVEQLQIQNMHVYKNIHASTSIGKVWVHAKTDKIYSMKVPITIMPGAAQKFENQLPDNLVWASDAYLYPIQIQSVEDAYNHTIEDGTEVGVFIQQDSLYTLASATVVNGEASVYLPSASGNTTATGLLYFNSLAPMQTFTKSFEPILDNIPLKVSADNISIGPLISVDGHILPDGTSIQVYIDDVHETHITTLYIENGMAELSIPSYKHLIKDNKTIWVSCLHVKEKVLL